MNQSVAEARPQQEQRDSREAPPRLVREIPVDAIDVNPLNPKSRLAPDPELMASIEELGLLQPVVVRPLDGGRFQLLAGHRRLAAFRELGRPTIPGLEFDAAIADGAVLLAENVAREDFDPLEESEIVAALLEQKLSQEAIAKALGHSVPWVARRANLRTLSPNARKQIRGGGSLAKWPPAWLEELALLAPKAQDQLVGTDRNPNWQLERVASLEELQHLIAKELRPLRRAPWDIADEQLVRAVGSCTKCPKTSCAAAGLFGAAASDPKKVEDALCRDGVCWNGKEAVWLERQIAAARQKHGRGLLFFASDTTSHEENQLARELLPKGAELLHSYDHKQTSEKRGKPALVMTGKRRGKVILIEPSRPHRSTTPDGRPNDVATKRKALHRRRWKRVLKALEDKIQGTTFTSPDIVRPKKLKNAAPLEFVSHLIVRVLAAGARGLFSPFDSDEYSQAVEDLEGDPAAGLPAAKIPGFLWLGLRGDMAQLVRDRFNSLGYSTPATEKCLDGIEWLIELVSFDLAGARAIVEADLPEPKSWSKRGAAKGKGAQRELEPEVDPPAEEDVDAEPEEEGDELIDDEADDAADEDDGS